MQFIIITKHKCFKSKAEVKHVKKKISAVALLFLLAFPAVNAYKIKHILPSNICLTQNKELEIKLGGFVNAVDENGAILKKSSLILEYPEKESYDVDLNLFGIVPLKTITVSAASCETICPSGDAIGVKIYTDGVCVTAVEKNSPADKSGIACADVITHLNDVKILNTAHFSTLVSENGGKEIKITLVRNSNTSNVYLKPVYQNGEYVIGAWVRDSSAGIGTVTYVDTLNQSFGALGHGICDTDTQALLTLMQGSVTNCNIVDSIKGQKGEPGRLCATLQNNDIGIIEKNSNLGIYGKLDTNMILKSEPMPIATRYEIHEGEASILTSINDDKPQQYSAVIEKVNTADENGLSMVLCITDERLLKETGGIVQGMSGSPILQDGKFVGAVTHVFLNDPTRGYGVFIELMLAEGKEN